MQARPLPLVTWHSRSSQQAKGWQSILIALLRGVAAIEVAAAHLRALFYPGMRTVEDPSLWFQGFAFVTGFGHQAVLLFFVVSGWLVGGSLLDKWQQPDAIAHYAIDRASRLWTVMIPLFALTLLLGLFNGQVAGATIDYSPANEFSAAAFVGNMFGLQLILVPTFGENFALWSLSNETWYYLLFPLLVLMFRTRLPGTRTLCALAIAVIAVLLPPTLVLFFAVWLMGAAGSRIAIHIGPLARVLAIVLLVSASAYCRIKGYTDDLTTASFGYDLLLSGLFLLLLCSLQDAPAATGLMATKLAAVSHFFADFSFSIYMVHIPIIYTLMHWSHQLFGLKQLSARSPMHFLYYMAMLAAIIAGAWLFYRLFEAHTYRVRRWAKQKLLRRGNAPIVTA